MPQLSLRMILAGALACLMLLSIPSSPSLFGQSTSSKTKKTTSKKNDSPKVSAAQAQELSVRAEKARDQYIRDAFELSQEFEQAGLLEEAKTLLQSMQKLKNDLPGVKERIEKLDETMLSRNDAQIDIDVSKGWGDPLAKVEKDKPFRIRSGGTYKFSAQATLTPQGYPTGDPVKEMPRGVSCGALMAIIIPVDDKGKPGKPGQPIEVGTEKEITPRESGLLFVSVNAPPQHHSTGKLTIELSGNITTAQSQK